MELWFSTTTMFQPDGLIVGLGRPTSLSHFGFTIRTYYIVEQPWGPKDFGCPVPRRLDDRQLPTQVSSQFTTRRCCKFNFSLFPFNFSGILVVIATGVGEVTTRLLWRYHRVIHTTLWRLSFHALQPSPTLSSTCDTLRGSIHFTMWCKQHWLISISFCSTLHRSRVNVDNGSQTTKEKESSDNLAHAFRHFRSHLSPKSDEISSPSPPYSDSPIIGVAWPPRICLVPRILLALWQLVGPASVRCHSSNFDFPPPAVNCRQLPHYHNTITQKWHPLAPSSIRGLCIFAETDSEHACICYSAGESTVFVAGEAPDNATSPAAWALRFVKRGVISLGSKITRHFRMSSGFETCSTWWLFLGIPYTSAICQTMAMSEEAGGPRPMSGSTSRRICFFCSITFYSSHILFLFSFLVLIWLSVLISQYLLL